MGERYLEAYMRRLGWGSGFNLPIANNENKELEKKLEAIQRKVVQYRSELDDAEQSVEGMTTHADHSRVLIANMGKMAQTQRATLEHARNLNVTAENNLKNLKRDIKVKKSELEYQQHRHGKTRCDLEKRQLKVNQLSAEVEWDQTAIATLRNSSKDEETDVELMAKYFNLDETTIKEGEYAYSKMKGKRDKLKMALEAELSQTQSAELVLNRVCNQFRQVHKSRNDAVALWRGVIESLKMRDADLEVLAQDYTMLKQNLRTVGQVIQDREYLLKTTQLNTVELATELRAIEKSTAFLRQRIVDNQLNMKRLTPELKQTRQEIKETSVEIRSLQKRKSSCLEEAENIDKIEEELKTELGSIRIQHKKFKYGSSSTDEKFRQMATILDMEEERLTDQEKEVDRRRLLLMQSTNQIGEHKKCLVSLGFEMKGKENQLSLTRKLTDAQYFDIQQKRRNSHELDLKILSLNEKIGKHRLEIEQIDGKPDEILGKLKKLRSEFKTGINAKAKQENLTSFTDSILQRLKREITQFSEQGGILDAGNENVRILITTYKKDIFGGTKALQQTKFDFQMILLTRNRLIEILDKRKKRFFSASKQYLELETATDERRAEIEIHLKLLDQRKKTLVDNKTRILLNMNDIKSYLKHWKTKYEFVMTTMASGSESGSPSEAFLIVKFAQERECLKREGEVWDTRVRQAEKEVEGLQNTLALLSNSNQNFKTSLAPPWRKSSVALRASMTEKLHNDFQILKQRSERQHGFLVQTLNEKKSEFIQIEKGIQLMRDTLADRRQELSLVYREITNQKTKIDRASLLTRRLLRQMEEIGPEELGFIESEIKLRCLREKYEFSIKTMRKTIETFPKLQPWILNYFKSNKLFSKLAEKLEKHESAASTFWKGCSPKLIGTEKMDRTPLSRHMSLTSQENIIKQREIQRIGSAVEAPLSEQQRARPSKLPATLPEFRESSPLSIHEKVHESKPPKSILRRGQSSVDSQF